jgi:hypothetical protein
MIHRPAPTFVAALALAVAACSTPAPPPPAPAAASQAAASGGIGIGGQLDLKLASGRYRCELGIEVAVGRNPKDPWHIEVDWNGQHYTMARNPSSSGLPRYEHRTSGLVWIDLPWKGILLNSNTGRPIASECSNA